MQQAMQPGHLPAKLEDDAAEAQAQAFAYTVFILIVLLAIVLGYWIRRLHLRYCTEGACALLLGASAGAIVSAFYLVRA